MDNNNHNLNRQFSWPKAILALITILLILALTWWIVTKQNLVPKTPEITTQQRQNQENAAAKKIETEALKKQEESTTSASPQASNPSSQAGDQSSINRFVEYNPNAVSQTKGGIHVVLFFNAAWSPTSQTLAKDIESKKDNIDPKVNIVNVDFDNNQGLRNLYGVTKENEIIEVESNGKVVKKTANLANTEAIVNWALKE